MSVAWLALAAAALATRASDGSRLRLAELEARGPLASATLELGSAGRATLLLDLAPGDSRRLLAPLPARDGLEALEPVSSDPALRFVAWVSESQRERELAAVPLALRTRPAPPAPEGSEAPSAAALALALAAGLCVQRLRARPALALLLGAVAAGAVVALDLAGGAARPARSVLDFEAGAEAGIRWRVARGALDLGGEPPARLAVAPETRPLELRLDARGDGPVRAVAEARGASLGRADVVRAAPLERSGNRWGDLAEVWTRDADGAWAFHGAWGFGEPLPAAVEGERASPAPPGWINPALPQGRTLLVARAREPDAGAEVWWRIVGF